MPLRQHPCRRSFGLFVCLFTAFSLVGGCASTKGDSGSARAPAVTSSAHGSKEDVAPEQATGFRKVAPFSAKEFVVATAHPDATAAGVSIIEAGGNAIDAAVAVQMMLTLVEPQSSGIGGGAFMLNYDAKNDHLGAWDGRETAPAAADKTLFLDDAGKPLPFFDAVVGGLSVGVPGVVRMLAKAQAAHGKLPWAQLLQPAIEKADAGFVIGPRLHAQLLRDKYLPKMKAAGAYFYRADGTPHPVGTVLKNPALAKVLRSLAKKGPDVFYKGELADAMVDAVHHEGRSPGLLSKADLAGYQAKERTPVCANYRDYQVCGMPPPTSGGLTTLQILGILENFDLSAHGPLSVENAHLLAEASRLAFADRGIYIADSDFVRVPIKGLLNRAYLKKRAALIPLGKDMGAATAGDPPADKAALWAPDQSPELPCTSHFAIWDKEGNVVSMTTSVENVFGSRVMVRGFLLNNQLTDFSFVPEQDGLPVKNAVAAGKRPRSSMSPIIVLDKNTHKPVLAIGSPGGSRIIGYVAQTLINVLDHQMSIQEAIALPHIVNRNGKTELEVQPDQHKKMEALAKALRALGHDVKLGEQNSGLHGIQKVGDTLVGGADPRREGVADGR